MSNVRRAKQKGCGDASSMYYMALQLDVVVVVIGDDLLSTIKRCVRRIVCVDDAAVDVVVVASLTTLERAGGLGRGTCRGTDKVDLFV